MTLAERLVSRNALLGRYAFPQLRPMACSISVGIYLTVAILVLTLGYAANYRQGHLYASDFWHTMFISFAVLQVFMLWILGMYHAGSAVQQEVAEKSMDFFRLLPLSPAQKIIGVLVGRNLVVLALAVVNTLILGVCGMASGVAGTVLAEFVLFSWVASVAAMLSSFLSATFETRGRLTSGPLVVLVLSMFFLPYAIGMAANWHDLFPQGAFVSFFHWRVDLFAFLTVFALYACVWFVSGLVRRFTKEREALFTARGAVLCLVGALVIAAGLGCEFLKETVAVAVCWLGTGLVTLIITLGSLRGWDAYVESVGMTLTRPGLRAANLSNLALASALILIWGAFAAIMDLLAGRPIPLGAVPVLMTFGLVLAALMEFSVTHAALTPRVYLLGGFAAGLYCILPLVVAAVMDSMAPMRFSPFGYVTQLGDRGGGSWDPAWLNIALLLLLGFLIRRRYRSI